MWLPANLPRPPCWIGCQDCGERLAETLLTLSNQYGQFRPEGIEIRATNDELGALADISPFTTSRVLNNWVHAGTVSKLRGRVVLRAPEALMID